MAWTCMLGKLPQSEVGIWFIARIVLSCAQIEALGRHSVLRLPIGGLDGFVLRSCKCNGAYTEGIRRCIYLACCLLSE